MTITTIQRIYRIDQQDTKLIAALLKSQGIVKKRLQMGSARGYIIINTSDNSTAAAAILKTGDYQIKSAWDQRGKPEFQARQFLIERITAKSNRGIRS